MNCLFDFETQPPPLLNQRLLEQRLEEKRQRRNAVLLALGSLLWNLAALAAFCLQYVRYGLAGVLPLMIPGCLGLIMAGVLAVIWTYPRKEENIL